MSEQAPQPAPDPVRVLEDTRRTLLKLAANIEAALADVKERSKAKR